MVNSNQQNVVIIGASHAAVALATNLRRQNWPGSITLFSEENELPYHRPPLSKDFLVGTKSADQLRLKQLDFYQSNQIDLNLGCRVTAIDGNKVEYCSLVNGENQHINFDKLIFATGARPRILPNSQPHERMCYVRNIKDIEQIQNKLSSPSNVVLIGGGYIGLEIAASLRQLNHSITVLESMPRLLARVAAQPVSDYFARLHTKFGVNISTDAQVTAINHNTDASTITLADGKVLAADLVIVGIGVIPNTELAESIGVNINNGIRVDENLQTNLANIYAIGDCANFFHPQYGDYVRLESVPNCNCHAKRLAAHLLGNPSVAPEQPWFWSDQYQTKLQIAGLSRDYDDVIVKQGVDDNSMVVGYMKEGNLIALDCLNMPKIFTWGKKNLSQSSCTADFQALNTDTA